MYLGYYGLKELPFALTPDPRYLYFTPSHTEAIANLQYGIESGRGLIVITGEVGTGKTTILRWMLSRLDRTVMSAYIFNPRLSVARMPISRGMEMRCGTSLQRYSPSIRTVPEYNRSAGA